MGTHGQSLWALGNEKKFVQEGKKRALKPCLPEKQRGQEPKNSFVAFAIATWHL